MSSFPSSPVMGSAHVIQGFEQWDGHLLDDVLSAAASNLEREDSAMIAETIIFSAASAVSPLAAQALKAFIETFIEKKTGKKTPVTPEDLRKLLQDLENDAGEEKTLSLSISALKSAQETTNSTRIERARQARLAFNVALALSSIGVAIIIIGIAYLFVTGASGAGIVTTAVGAVTELAGVILFRLNKDTNDRLDALADDARILQSTQIAVEVASHIEDKNVRDETIREVILQISKNKRQSPTAQQARPTYMKKGKGKAGLPKEEPPQDAGA